MKALVLGGADCLWDDLRALGPFSGIVIAVNDAGVVYPHRIDHWASLHAEKFSGWVADRRSRGGSQDFTTWTRPEKSGLSDRTLSGWSSGSSGMLAVGVALELGAEAVMLAGVPMDPEAPHFFDDRPWHAADVHWPAWLKREDRLRGKVFSMSGRTREWLGSPPWLPEREAA